MQINLEASAHTSRVLSTWLEGRPGSTERVGLAAMATPESGAVSDLTGAQLAAILGMGAHTASGAIVTAETAMRQATVYACVSLLAGTIATLPFGIFERDGQTRKPVDHPYWWTLNESANDDMTAVTAMEYFLAGRFFHGDGFGRLLRPSPYTNQVSGWEPMHPLRVTPFNDTDKARTLYYRYVDRFGNVSVLDKSDVIHVPSLGFDGLRSPSPITYAAREAIGTALAAEEYSGRFYSQGSTHDIALKSAKGSINKNDAETLMASYQARYGGGKNNRMPLILTGGLEVERLSITPQDAALLPTRIFSVEEICRIFGIPPYMVGSTSNATSFGSGVEQQGIWFVKFTLRRLLSAIEQEFNRKLWPSRAKYFAEFSTTALERGDFKTRMEGNRVAVGRAGEPGWKTPNEVRREENLPDIDGGNKLNTGIVMPATKGKTDDTQDQPAAAAG